MATLKEPPLKQQNNLKPQNIKLTIKNIQLLFPNQSSLFPKRTKKLFFPGPAIIGLFTDTAAILISIVSNSYYGMPRGQIHINLPPEHPIMSLETIEIKMAAVLVKRSIVTSRG